MTRSDHSTSFQRVSSAMPFGGEMPAVPTIPTRKKVKDELTVIMTLRFKINFQEADDLVPKIIQPYD